MASEAPAKRQRSAKDVPYQLVYWPGVPGRGEHVRLALEEAGAEYSDTAREEGGVKTVAALINPENLGEGDNVPPLAPPILIHGELTINQTPNILLYLGPRLGLAPKPDDGEDPDGIYRINTLVLTALDGLSNEVHDCHHPINTGLYYDDQQAEALRASKEYVATRLPKFLGYFERVLKAAEGKHKSSDGTTWLYGGRLTYADLVLFQSLDGTRHQFPRAVQQARESGDYSRVFALYDAVQERPNIAKYLKSDRRQKYGNGIYRYYKELDVLPEEAKEAQEE